MAISGVNAGDTKVSLRPSSTTMMKPLETSLPVPAVVGTATSGSRAVVGSREMPA